MPRDGSGIYTQPFPDVAPATTIESAVYNGFVADVATDLNAPRPIIAGGTGASSAQEARFNLGSGTATQLVTNYDSHLFAPGGFRSAAGATGAPLVDHDFAGFAYINEALANPPTNQNVVLAARDLDDDAAPGIVYIREKKDGVWGAWIAEPNAAQVAAAIALKVNKAGDTMTGNLIIDNENTVLILKKDASGDFSAVHAMVGDLTRWIMYLGDATLESGTNLGSDFALFGYDDAGAALATAALRILRSENRLTLAGPPTAATHAATKAYVDAAIAAIPIPPAAIPAGTTMLFVQGAAPTGWTKQTLWNDAALRVVNGSTGGNFTGAGNFSFIFGQTVTNGTTLTSSTLAAAPVGILTASGPATGSVQGTNPWGKDGGWVSQDYYVTAANNVEGLRAGGQAHSHAMDMRVSYLDTIVCYKN